MSLEYTLEVLMKMSSERVLHLLAEKLEAELLPPHQGAHESLKGFVDVPKAALVSVQEPSPIGQTVIEEAFNFRPNMTIGFRLNKEDVQAGEKVIAKSIKAIDSNVEKFVLLFNGEETVVLKAEGKTLLSDSSPYMITHELEREGICYEKCKLESPLIA